MDMNVADAAYNVGEDYRDGGTAGLARRMGKNPTSLSHELTRTGTAKLGLLDAVKMSVMSGDLRILQAFADACGMTLVPLPPPSGLSTQECIQRLGVASERFGLVAADTCAILADGKVNSNELARFRSEKGNLSNAMHQLDQALAAKCEEGRIGGASEAGEGGA